MSLSPGKIHYTREASARAFPPFAPPPPLRSSRARKSVLAVEKNAKYRGEFAGIIHTGARGKMPRINRGQETLSLSGITCSVWRVHAIFPYTRAAGHLQLPRRRRGCTDEINLIASSTNKYPWILYFVRDLFFRFLFKEKKSSFEASFSFFFFLFFGEST